MEGQPVPDESGIVQPAAEQVQPAGDAVMESASLKRAAPDDVADATEPDAKQPRLEGAAAEGYAAAYLGRIDRSTLFLRDLA
jgi:hypothetical protein